jgi:hypothetical protein
LAGVAGSARRDFTDNPTFHQPEWSYTVVVQLFPPCSALLLASTALVVMTAQVRSRPVPRFEDFPVTEHWNGNPAQVKLTTSSERMFRTRLIDAGKEQPNFAGHYRIVMWGCGSNCRAAAVVDLTTGVVFPPPLAARGEGWAHWVMGSEETRRSIDSRADSRLAVVKSIDVPDVYYFVWQDNHFREILHTSEGNKTQ